MTGRQPLTPAERQRLSRQRRAQAGGQTITVTLTPCASAKLATLVSRGETATAAINRLLERQRIP